MMQDESSEATRNAGDRSEEHRAISRRTIAFSAIAAAVLAFVGSWVLHAPSALHDTDTYYHLHIARTYAEQGIVDELPELRRSLLRDGFGDKELLFHLLLAPLAGNLDPLTAGRLGLAFFAALLAAAVAGLATRAVGAWGVVVPFWLFFASTELAWRVVRLRPELLSLFLLLVAVWAIAEGRGRLLGAITFLYTWSYTAFQALVGLVGLAFVYLGWSRRRWAFSLLLYAVLGAALALFFHPHFPKNLEIWAVQNVRFFLEKGRLAVGTEIRPNFTDVALMVNLGWLFGLAVLWRSATPDPVTPAGSAAGNDGDARLADVLAIAAVAFGGLYLLMSRFSLYAIPLATLWLLFELRRRGRRIGAWMSLPGRGRVPLAVAALACLLVSLPEAWRQLENYRHRTFLGEDDQRIRDREAFAAAIPEGARVAADWGPTGLYLLWAPQGRYLNALDPVFMAVVDPVGERRLNAILDAREPDVPWTTAAVLDSDFLAYPTIGHAALDERLRRDPRVVVRHRGAHTLVGFRPPPPGSGRFLVDWRVVPKGRDVAAIGPREEISAWPAYPRPPDPRLAALEARVDADRVAPEAECVGFVRALEASAGRRELVLAPTGPTRLWLGDRLLVDVRNALDASPGGGLSVLLDAVPAEGTRLRVSTCKPAGGGGKGFSLLLREVP